MVAEKLENGLLTEPDETVPIPMENSPEVASAENPNEDADGTISAATMPGLQKYDGEIPPLFFLLRDEPWKSIPFIMFNVQLLN